VLTLKGEDASKTAWELSPKEEGNKKKKLQINPTSESLSSQVG
jgi:hypothetical protein